MRRVLLTLCVSLLLLTGSVVFLTAFLAGALYGLLMRT